MMFVVPAQLSVTVGTTTATSISLSWTTGSEVDSYEVMWISDECPDDVDEGSATITETSYIIEDLREGTSYAITVSATAGTSSIGSDSVTGETVEQSECMMFSVVYSHNFYNVQGVYVWFIDKYNYTHTPSSICCSHFCDNIQ